MNGSILNHTLIKAADLPHESVGCDAPPLFPTSAPFLCLVSYGLVEVGRLASARNPSPFLPRMTPAPLRPTPNYLDASPSTDGDPLLERSELAGAREDTREARGVMEVPESVGGLEDEGAIDVT